MADKANTNPYEAPRSDALPLAKQSMPRSVVVAIGGNTTAIIAALAFYGLTIADRGTPLFDGESPSHESMVGFFIPAAVAIWHALAIAATFKKLHFFTSSLAIINGYLALFLTVGFLYSLLFRPFMQYCLGDSYEEFAKQSPDVVPEPMHGNFSYMVGYAWLALTSIGCWTAAIAIFTPKARYYLGQHCPQCNSTRFRPIVGIGNPGKVCCRDCKTLWSWSGKSSKE